MPINRTVSVAVLALGVAFAVSGNAQGNDPPTLHAVDFNAPKKDPREIFIRETTANGLVPGSTIDAVDADEKPIAHYVVTKVRSHGTNARLDPAPSAAAVLKIQEAYNNLFYLRPHTKFTSCTAAQLPPIRETDKTAIVVHNKAPAGYVIVPIDLTSVINASDRRVSVPLGMSGGAPTVVPGTKGYIVTSVTPIVPTSVDSIEATSAVLNVDPDKIGIKPGTILVGVAAKSARAVLPSATCK